MSTYRFEPFDLDIIDPVVTAFVDTLTVQPTQMTISVDIKLETQSSSYGFHLDNIVVQNLQFQGYENLMERVMDRLQDFLI